MLIRIRSRDGLERVEVDSHATIAGLREKIADTLHVPLHEHVLSRDPKLLLSKDPSSFADMRDPSCSLSSLGIGHGSLIFMFYSGERVIPGPSSQPKKLQGGKMTVEELVAKQTRIERQESPHCVSVSFDRNAANAFQAYVNESLAFSIKRGAFMYGTVGDAGQVLVEAIYEPPQQGSEDGLLLMRDTEEEKQADMIAQALGLRRVGWIFTQTVSQNKAEMTISESELVQMAELQAESGLEHWVTALVKLETNEAGGADVHFEAFQASDQCVKLWRDGWFVPQEDGKTDPKVSQMKANVIVAGKDTRQVDNDFFLVVVPILDHQGPLSCTFPIENRLPPPSMRDLKSHLDKTKNAPYWARLGDFHVLLFISKFLVASDMAFIAEAVRIKGPVPDGYQLIIESLASAA